MFSVITLFEITGDPEFSILIGEELLPVMVFEENADSQNPRQQEKPIHTQVDDTDYDGTRDQLVFLIDLASTGTKTVFIRYVSEKAEDQMPLTFGFTKQTRAGIFPHLKALAAIDSEFNIYLLEANGSI